MNWKTPFPCDCCFLFVFTIINHNFSILQCIFMNFTDTKYHCICTSFYACEVTWNAPYSLKSFKISLYIYNCAVHNYIYNKLLYRIFLLTSINFKTKCRSLIKRKKLRIRLIFKTSTLLVPVNSFISCYNLPICTSLTV